MLRGVSAISLDRKGRIALPKRYRSDLIEKCQGSFVCTIDHQLPCLLLYPLPQWEQIEAKLAALSSLDPVERRLQRLLLGHAVECSMDNLGRILIAPTLRDYAKLDDKAMLVGQLNKFELWDHERWHQQIEQDIEQQAGSNDALSDRLSHFSL